MESEIQSVENIPSFLNSEAFISARFKEISALKNLINESSRVTSIFQRLPKHMRRRAMSHTIKRVPKNWRDAHRRQLEKNKALKTQRRPRKHYRKRPKNLLIEYNRRQKDNLWLETHIWHAKRFRMISKWGYKLADRSCDKTFRASYRAMSNHCLLQDVSYLCCMEMSGSEEILLEGFKRLTSSECGLTIGAKCWMSGNREGKVTLFHKDSYPFNVIGDVTFIWKPRNEDTSKHRTIWIWCHPSFYQELRQELIDVFNLECIITQQDIEMKEPTEISTPKNSKKSETSKENVERTKIALKNVPHSKIPKYINKITKVRLLSLKDALNRFRLTGPLSNAVLTNALHPAELFNQFLLHDQAKNWWKEFKVEKSTDCIPFKLLEDYNSPSYFPPHVVIGGQVIDPRLFLKRTRSKAIGKNQEFEPCVSLPPSVTESAIWNAHIRDDVSLNKFTFAQINKLRSNLLVPGHDYHLLKTVNTVIPLLLIQRPGSTNENVKLGFGNGWDVIIPSNWAIPIWLSLILCGAKAGALRETKTLNLEMKSMPELPPDSCAGRQYYQQIEETDRDHYFKKPPNKRINYIRNGFPTPFHHPWDILTNEWNTTQKENTYYVLRNKRILYKLKTHLGNLKNSSKIDLTDDLNHLIHDKCLIPVTIQISGKGHLAPFSHICVPKFSELQNTAVKWCSAPVEKLHTDKNKIKRKILRREHSKVLKRLRRQRIKQNKTAAKKLPLKITERKISPTEQIVQQYLSEIKNLWIPRTCTNLRNHCSREICGFIVTSGYSLMQAGVIGQGYITLQSLITLNSLWYNSKSSPLVLTRSPNSLHYRYAFLNVCV